MPLRCKLQEKITSCDSALTVVFIYSVQGDSMDSEAEEAPKKLVGIKAQNLGSYKKGGNYYVL